MRPYQWFPIPNTTHLLPIWSTVWLNLGWLKDLWMNLSTCTEGSSLDSYLPPTVRILHAGDWCHAGSDKLLHCWSCTPYAGCGWLFPLKSNYFIRHECLQAGAFILAQAGLHWAFCICLFARLQHSSGHLMRNICLCSNWLRHRLQFCMLLCI